MKKTTFTLILIISGVLIGLVWTAGEGNQVAIYILGLLTGVILLGLGVLLSILVSRSNDRRRQADVYHNLQENLAYLAQMQRVQSAQFRNQNYLPAPNPAEPFNLDAHLQYDDGVFNNLDASQSYPQEADDS